MFKVGDKVRIRKTSRFHDKSFDNPDNSVVGMVSETGNSFLPIVVHWDGGGRNSYDEIDLEFAEDDFEGNV